MAELAAASILFKQFEIETGTVGGARERFQQMVTDLVGLLNPGANEVAAGGGSDWGIDTYVGRLDDSILVWQSKFFIAWRGENERGQVRKSFNELVKKAEQENFKVSLWRLCVPCVLPPVEQKWFDNWSTKQKRTTGVQIELWNGVRLRQFISMDDAKSVRENYFPGSFRSTTPLPVLTAKNTTAFDSALFVRQLEEAGVLETDGAKGLFYAAEALARDIAGRGVEEEMRAFLEIHLDLLTVWEDHFNASAQQADARGRMGSFVRDVLQRAATSQDPPGIQLRPAHRRGITHRLVEDRRAGWVTHWRQVAANHSEPSTIDADVDKFIESGGCGNG
ncbi:hypothetical protein ACLRGI_22240 [Paenarthrobacter nitroguajacolicus]|uniref:hypothetical protein n=1 Tax=Paenarthrobacter nitroguajacolicus TaxID=211146 RepID=UPI003AE4D593